MSPQRPIEALLEQEVEWIELPEPEIKDGLYAVREGTLEIGTARLRALAIVENIGVPVATRYPGSSSTLMTSQGGKS